LVAQIDDGDGGGWGAETEDGFSASHRPKKKEKDLLFGADSSEEDDEDLFSSLSSKKTKSEGGTVSSSRGGDPLGPPRPVVAPKPVPGTAVGHQEVCLSFYFLSKLFEYLSGIYSLSHVIVFQSKNT
jgi:hypothetical protein